MRPVLFMNRKQIRIWKAVPLSYFTVIAWRNRNRSKILSEDTGNLTDIRNNYMC